ncbi:dihydrodipicolinate reductase [Amylolactobacillus amylotrophicus DSM 20534]|uniref:4-hydroxy-tetrahydrodipicolinate reductase n=3 Tax=Amylolactobacillus TaxID=2767876 RepID=A0A0R1YT67_9LACO|nr:MULTISPECIES: 4-hydroxy-tetrahydrodipicolinate reductase [Amylolactobacillus]APT18440.1 4-hydroxy-tetrahydrodipicolinate reductase [Amylolactobacillus amylophilus DSM 20533 = JCM 1125]KRK38227.1 dihydrodipicolinate reductase [Amylolactobacillus amylotrophicus DSM 20534]KRM43131.1 dihydrodipicolinate reductase [Amylolactobacillus amylophilus DSM 20533 = JCM 1125]GED80469.1 4-hydroxy-tetrahydrodipicolinate reductase [Amylolactobacillus amylophilus]
MQKVIVAGFTGSMGSQVVQLVERLAEFQLAGVYNPHIDSLNPTDFNLASSVQVFNNLQQITLNDAIWIDFSVPSAVFTNAKFALEHGLKPVIGTSGLSTTEIAQLRQIAAKKEMSGIIAPNFGLSAILLLKFAQTAARYFPDVEIIELHHADKLDAPSGTALATAKAIREVTPEKKFHDQQAASPARGLDHEGIKIHSVRLPGYVAHEEVLFGAAGEALTIRQDSFDRASFMRGVELALNYVSDNQDFIVGLENIL